MSKSHMVTGGASEIGCIVLLECASSAWTGKLVSVTLEEHNDPKHTHTQRFNRMA